MKAFERFIKYASFETTSNEANGNCPSSEGQLDLANYLKDELLSLGLSDARVDKNGYVYASLPANSKEKCNAIGFIAHLDTSPEASGKDVKMNLVDYKGGDVLLNPEKKIWMRVKDYPYLAHYIGHHLLTSDGTTLIGADDKAGIAEIVTALEKIINSGVKHGKISVAFTPDEEIGRGADLFDVKEFGADYAYTVDGGAIGELEYENFNAASATVTVHGISIHPGSAKDRMKNASLIGCEFNSLLNSDEIPEKTEGYEGFHHLLSMTGEIELAKLNYIIRDHSMEKFEEKKEEFKRCAAILNEKYGEGTVELELRDSYYNMRKIIEKNSFIVERAERAMLACKIAPIVVPIRGGTDGARLSFMGLPCPNICTGGENFHSRFEFVSVESMEKISDIIVKIAELALTDGKEKVITE